MNTSRACSSARHQRLRGRQQGFVAAGTHFCTEESAALSLFGLTHWVGSHC